MGKKRKKILMKNHEGEFWADKLMDLANLAAAALVLSQFVTEKINSRT